MVGDREQHLQGMVNARYLAQDVPGGEFRGDARVLRRLDELAAVVREQGDLTPVASARGLVFDVFAPPVLIEPADLPTALEEDATREFGGVECAPGDCPQTVRDVMAGCTSMLTEDSSELVYDEPVGSIGALHAVAYRPPAELANLHYVALYEEDEASGHWSACYVYFTYEAGRPVVAGIGKDATGI